MGYRKPGRPAKHIGLSMPELKQVANGGDVRDLQASDEKQEGSVLPDPRPANPPATRKLGVFGTVDRDNGERSPTPIQPAVLNTPGRPDAPDSADVAFTKILKQVGLEIAAPDHQDKDTVMTNLEALVRRVWDEALSHNIGSQRARELIVERLEGKAVRGDKPAVVDTTIEDQLESTEADLINSVGRKET